MCLAGRLKSIICGKKKIRQDLQMTELNRDYREVTAVLVLPLFSCHAIHIRQVSIYKESTFWRTTLTVAYARNPSIDATHSVSSTVHSLTLYTVIGHIWTYYTDHYCTYIQLYMLLFIVTSLYSVHSEKYTPHSKAFHQHNMCLCIDIQHLKTLVNVEDNKGGFHCKLCVFFFNGWLRAISINMECDYTISAYQKLNRSIYLFDRYKFNMVYKILID